MYFCIRNMTLKKMYIVCQWLLSTTVSLWASPLTATALQPPPPYSDTIVVQGCDSVWSHNTFFFADTLLSDSINTDTILYTFVVVHPSYLRVDSVNVCDNYTWLETGFTYYASTQKTVTRTSIDGCDSICQLVLTLRHSTTSSNEFSGCDSATWEGLLFYYPYGSTSYAFVIDTTLTLTNAQGCDGSKSLHLTLYPSYQDTLSATSCDEYTWQRTGQTFHTSGFFRQDLPTTHGCDSSSILILTIVHSYVHEIRDSFCIGSTYQFYDRTLTHGGSYHQDYVSAVWPYCDSIEVLILYQLQRPQITIEHSFDCDSLKHYIGAGTPVSYHRWSAEPPDPRLDEHVSDFWIRVNPTVPTVYTFYADYKEEETCPSSKQITILPITRPKAVIESEPSVLTPKRPMLTLRDRSSNASWREWFIDDQFFSYAVAPTYTTNFSSDSITILLVAHNDFCTDSDSVYIRVINETLWIPNAITPNQLTNNRFVIQGDGIASFSIDIYDRRGIQIFHSNNIEDSWDGTYGGELVAPGNYMYYITYTTEAQPRTILRRRGAVLVIR